MFHNWCYEQDRKESLEKYYEDVPNNVPCVSEIFRYVQWHNHALLLTKDLNISTMILHYEDYANDLNSTAKRLFTFLEYDMVAPPPSFFQHDYSFMYTEDERDRIKKWVQDLASRNFWKLVEHYFH